MTLRQQGNWYFGTLGVLVAILGIATACSPHRPTDVDANDWVNQLRFTRHRNGMCFAVLEFPTDEARKGVTVTLVPDEACR